MIEISLKNDASNSQINLGDMLCLFKINCLSSNKYNLYLTIWLIETVVLLRDLLVLKSNSF